MKQLLLSMMLLLPLGASADESGACGDSITWTFVESSKTMIIAGSGDMPTYIFEPYAPWYEFRDSIENLVIEEGVTSIGVFAFGYCSNLASLTIPNSVTDIGGCAFQDCSSLTSVAIPSSVTYIGNYAFSGCIGLKSITVDRNNPVFDSRDHCNAIIQTATNKLVVGCQTTVIPNGVATIGSAAFCSCTSLTSITIPNSVTTIESQAFDHCKGLTSVTFSDSLTTIDSFAFRYCTSLISANIPNSVTAIGTDAFSDCKSLTTLTIPNRLTSISTCVFQNCASLTSVIIPESITTIEGDAFLHCTSLASVIISDGVTSIGEYAFNGCGFTFLTIPAKVASIGEYAFYNCNSLAVINVEAVNPPQISDNTFQFYDIPLVVPISSTDTYKADEVWRNFTNIYEGQLPVGISDANSQQVISRIYSPNGKRLSKMQNGLNIIVKGDGAVKKVMHRTGTDRNGLFL